MNRYATTDFERRFLVAKRNFIVYISLFCIPIILLFGMLHLEDGHQSLTTSEFITAAALTFNLIYLKHSRETTLAGEIFLAILATVGLIIFADGGYAHTGNIWASLFPLVALYLQGIRRGLYWIFSHFITLCILSYFIYNGTLPAGYTPEVLQQNILFYVVVLVLAYLNERLKESNYQHTINAHNEITSVLDNMQDTFYRTDKNNRFLVITPSVYALLGYHNYELTRHSLIHLLANEDERDYLKAMLENSEGHIKNLELKVKHKNGRDIWILVNAHRYYNTLNEESGIEGTFKDITEQKHYQVELIKLNELQEQRISAGVMQLRKKDELMLQQAKMAQMGEMISMIAHQWRQPLSTIRAIAQNLRISTMLNEPISSDLLNNKLQSISSHVSLLSETIDDFRNFFRPDKEKNSFIVDDLIHKALDVLESSLHQDTINLTLDLNLKIPIVSFQNELLQVLINLISNAIDALNKEQPIKHITITSSHNQKMAVITIEDNAGGIKKENIDTIFEPYFSTKETKNGTGLGLYMSKIIIQEHCQGELNAKNSSDGAIFTLKLPL
jgi:PAS domain S-box-containing protein